MGEIKKKPYIISGIAFTILTGLLTSLYFLSQETVFPWKRFALIVGLSLAISAIILVLVYQILSFKDKKQDTEESNKPKEHVSAKDIERILIEEIAEYTNMGRIMNKKDPRYKLPINKDAIKIRNSKPGADTKGGTGNMFQYLEVYISEGEWEGNHIFVIRKDLGKKYIRENWREVHEMYTNFIKSELKPYDSPLSSTTNEHTMLQMKRIDAMGEDYDPEEMYSEFMKTQNQTNGNGEREKKPEKKIKTEEVEQNTAEIEKYLER